MLTGDCNTVNHDGDGGWLLDEEYPEDKMITIIATEVLVCSILQKVFWSLLTSLRSQPICQQMVITTHPDHCAFARAGSNNIQRHSAMFICAPELGLGVFSHIAAEIARVYSLQPREPDF